LRDIDKEWNGWDEYKATKYMFENYVGQTSGMAKTNPGWDTGSYNQFWSPKMTHNPQIEILDYVVKQKLFNFYLVMGCVPLRHDHGLSEEISKNNPWKKPVTVYGYDNTVALAGDLFEAETTCTKSHNWGQVASSSASNMAFHSRKASITAPLPRNKDNTGQTYNVSKTYISFIIGDGDNVGMLVGSRRDWMEQRTAKCKNGEGCFPLLWSMSPALPYMGPDMLTWFNNKLLENGNDFFVLPPSGHTYSYPGEMKDPDLAEFVRLTEEDAKIQGTSSSVVWEWMGTWGNAVKNYFPRYSKNNILKAGYAVNVPFMAGTLVDWKYNTFTILGADNGSGFVLFRPSEWRGTSGSRIPGEKDTLMSVADKAKQINSYKKGSVTHIYLTSDGGANLQTLYDLVAKFDEHIEIVSDNTLAEMARSQAAAIDAQRAVEVVV